MKVIAIINEPRSCSRCPFNHVEISYEECRLSQRQLSAVESLMIPEWCELRPIPKRERVSVSVNNGIYLTGLKELGWNECIDAIVGTEDVD